MDGLATHMAMAAHKWGVAIQAIAAMHLLIGRSIIGIFDCARHQSGFSQRPGGLYLS